MKQHPTARSDGDRTKQVSIAVAKPAFTHDGTYWVVIRKRGGQAQPKKGFKDAQSANTAAQAAKEKLEAKGHSVTLTKA